MYNEQMVIHVNTYHKGMDNRSRELARVTLGRQIAEAEQMLEIADRDDVETLQVFATDKNTFMNALALVQPIKYTIQQDFIYGWDYVGSDGEGNRVLFDSRIEAEEDLKTTFLNFEASNYDHDPEEWRIVEYNEADDDKGDL